MHVLQHCAATLIDKYLHDTRFHNKLKIVGMTAIFGKQNLQQDKNHKPMNMLPDISKIYETLIQKLFSV